LCFTKLAASEGGSVAGGGANESASASRQLAAGLGAPGSTRYISLLIQSLSGLDGFSFFGLFLNDLFTGSRRTITALRLQMEERTVGASRSVHCSSRAA
jgi:hypothetical protein